MHGELLIDPFESFYHYDADQPPEEALAALQRGDLLTVEIESGLVLAGDLFTASGDALRTYWRDAGTITEEEPFKPILTLLTILVESVDQIEAFAADLSNDGRVVAMRLMPGPLALVVAPSDLAPASAFNRDAQGAPFVALSASKLLPIVDLLRTFGRPLLTIPWKRPGETHPTSAGAALDVRRRPARLLRTGSPTAEQLSRYVLFAAPTP